MARFSTRKRRALALRANPGRTRPGGVLPRAATALQEAASRPMRLWIASPVRPVHLRTPKRRSRVPHAPLARTSRSTGGPAAWRASQECCSPFPEPPRARHATKARFSHRRVRANAARARRVNFKTRREPLIAACAPLERSTHNTGSRVRMCVRTACWVSTPPLKELPRAIYVRQASFVTCSLGPRSASCVYLERSRPGRGTVGVGTVPLERFPPVRARRKNVRSVHPGRTARV